MRKQASTKNTKDPKKKEKEGKDGKKKERKKGSKDKEKKGLAFLQKLKEGTANATKKVVASMKRPKKKQKEKDSDSDSSSSTPSKSVVEVRADNPFLAHNQQKKALVGALQGQLQADGVIQKLIGDDRPDLETKGLSEAEAKILDNYLKAHTELISGDHLYTEDNNDEDNRSFTRYEIETKYNEGRYTGVYLAIRRICKQNVIQPDELLCIVKLALRKNSARVPYFLWNEARILQELGNKRLEQGKTPFTPIHVDSGKICDMPFIVTNLLDRNLAKIREDCDGKFGSVTALYVAIDTLNSIADLHGKNYIHRDIKPTNFCCGMEDLNHKLFLIDFGDAVKKGDKQGRLGVADSLTLPYWSLEVHSTGNCSERGDMESWFYIILEILEAKAFSWAKQTKGADVETAKRSFWTEYKKNMTNKTLLAVADILADKKEMSFPKDYQTIKQKLQEALDEVSKKSKVNPEWVKTKSPNPPKKKAIPPKK